MWFLIYKTQYEIITSFLYTTLFRRHEILFKINQILINFILKKKNLFYFWFFVAIKKKKFMFVIMCSCFLTSSHIYVYVLWSASFELSSNFICFFFPIPSYLQVTWFTKERINNDRWVFSVFNQWWERSIYQSIMHGGYYPLDRNWITKSSNVIHIINSF